MEFSKIILEKEENIAIITLNRPPMNPISIELVKEINAAINNIQNDPSIRAVIITGAGERAFAAGAELPKSIINQGFPKIVETLAIQLKAYSHFQNDSLAL